MRDGFVKVAVGTPEVRVADCVFNREKSLELILQAAEQGVKLLVLPELGLTGYTCGDLFYQRTLLDGAEKALEQLLKATEEREIVFLVGMPVRMGGLLFNCAVVCQGGEILGVVPKSNLIHDEKRWFAEAPAETTGVELCGQAVLFGTDVLFCCEELPEFVFAAELCYDLWVPGAPSAAHAAAGATVLCGLNATSEAVGKASYRRQLVLNQSAKCSAAYLFAAAGDGESTSDMIYGGHNMIAENGVLLAERRFETGLLCAEIDVCWLEQERRRLQNCDPGWTEDYEMISFHLTMEETKLTRSVARSPFVPVDEQEKQDICEEILTIAALGLKRRLAHTWAKTAVIGLSGGLDSTLALLITLRAFDMLGRDRKDILAVTMPCFGTTQRTRSNAEILAERSGCSFKTVPIGDTVRSHFADIGQSMDNHDVTFENGQARERTQVLMDLANMTGGMVVGTGDLSELALGWATYNGDHMSMYGVNGAIPKTLVRHLVNYVARHSEDETLANVLDDILDTPVSPELLPAVDGKIAQKTEDLVGPYDLHDFFLYYIMRRAYPPKKIYRLAKHAFAGEFDEETIAKWLKTFYRRFFTQQFKRSCLPDGPAVGSISVSPRAGWKMPSDAVRTMWQLELDEI